MIGLAVLILGKWWVHYFGKLLLNRYRFYRELGGHCIHDGFYMHQEPWGQRQWHLHWYFCNLWKFKIYTFSLEYNETDNIPIGFPVNSFTKLSYKVQFCLYTTKSMGLLSDTFTTITRNKYLIRQNVVWPKVDLFFLTSVNFWSSSPIGTILTNFKLLFKICCIQRYDEFCVVESQRRIMIPNLIKTL